MTKAKATDPNGCLVVGLIFGGIYFAFVYIPSAIEESVRTSIEMCVVEESHKGDIDETIMKKLFPLTVQYAKADMEIEKVVEVPMPKLTGEQVSVFAGHYRDVTAYEKCVKSEASRRYELEELKRLRKERKK